VTYYVRNWPQDPPPPHPGVFEEFFPAILRNLVGSRSKLTLFVKAVGRDYFDELDFIEKNLASRNLGYVLLPSKTLPADPRILVNIGSLIFEWPIDQPEAIDYIVDEWFISPQVAIEGYISPEPPLARIAQLYFQPDTERRIRELLSDIEFGFRLWTDNNGIFLLTDKFNIDTLKNRLQVAALNRALQEAACRYDARG